MKLLIFTCFLLLIGCGRQSEPRQSTSRDLAIDTSSVLSEGQHITQSAFQTLSSNLQQAMSEGGIEHALQFCNVEAMPLTDSLSSQYGIELKRASHRPRNPDNRADSLEAATIERYLQQLEREEELNAAVYSNNRQIIFHSPIRIQSQLCLSCHGEPEADISESDLQTIQELYPDDRATGFEMGELRGIWAIKFPEAYFDSLDLE